MQENRNIIREKDRQRDRGSESESERTATIGTTLMRTLILGIIRPIWHEEMVPTMQSSVNMIPDYSNVISCHKIEGKGANVSIPENLATRD